MVESNYLTSQVKVFVVATKITGHYLLPSTRKKKKCINPARCQRNTENVSLVYVVFQFLSHMSNMDKFGSNMLNNGSNNKQ